MKIIFIPYFFCIFISIIAVLVYLSSSGYIVKIDSNGSVVRSIGQYQWPVIGYNRITSYFGKRDAPTTGASTYHSGIDIGAPTGSNLVSCISGKVVYAGFKGAGGNTIIIQNGNIQAIYCHVDSKYYPVVGTYVNSGDIIGKVGPKNIYDILDNPYKDNNGNPTNGATTGPHLHFGIKVDGENVNPLKYL